MGVKVTNNKYIGVVGVGDIYIYIWHLAPSYHLIHIFNVPNSNKSLLLISQMFEKNISSPFNKD
jgi:hypothetical protein